MRPAELQPGYSSQKWHDQHRPIPAYSYPSSVHSGGRDWPASSSSSREPTSDAARHISDVAYESQGGFGAKLLDHGRDFLERHQLLGEGPKPLRAMCLLGGLSMVLVSLLSLVNILSLFSRPATYILQIYELFFGLIVVVIEAKDVALMGGIRPWIHEWFKFATVPGGKGAFYLFIGTLGVALIERSILDFIVGLYMIVAGVFCVLIHIGLKRKLRQGMFMRDPEPEAWSASHRASQTSV